MSKGPALISELLMFISRCRMASLVAYFSQKEALTAFNIPILKGISLKITLFPPSLFEPPLDRSGTAVSSTICPSEPAKTSIPMPRHFRASRKVRGNLNQPAQNKQSNACLHSTPRSLPKIHDAPPTPCTRKTRPKGPICHCNPRSPSPPFDTIPRSIASLKPLPRKSPTLTPL